MFSRRRKRRLSTDPQQKAGRAVPARESRPDTSSTLEASFAPSFPDGVKVLHDCPDAVVDICFVHGLTGDRESTWTAKGQSTPWPQELLPARLERARILSLGYDAYYIARGSVASSNRLIDHARNLLNDLTTDRAGCNASSRTLIFVAHSLGGLVCKEAILSSRNNPEPHLCHVFNHTKGVIFMGTPHRGTWMADWAPLPAPPAGPAPPVNKSILQVLQTNNELLESIQVRFVAMVREQRERGNRPLEVTCFYEELPQHFGRTIVSKESATLDSYHTISIHANHSDMVLFVFVVELGFMRLLGELVRWEAEVRKGRGVPAAAAKLIEACLRSLAFPKMYDRYLDISQATLGTCQWLLRHDTYKDWTRFDCSLLWIKGKPGSGKSTLLKHTLDHLNASGAFVLSFYFHGRGVELQKSPLGLFRSLLHQLLRDSPEALSDLVDTFNKKCKEIGEPGKGWQWHPRELWSFFEASLKGVLSSRSVFLVVDALDECGEKDAIDLVQKFNALSKSCQSLPNRVGQFRICFTCRHYPIVELDHTLEICVEKENGTDISGFVDDQLAAFHTRTPSPIPDFITDRASGVFLWAFLVVKRVLDLERKGHGLKKFEAEIRLIPPELDYLYRTLVKEMEPASLKLIQWITFATRPLNVDELRWAMVIEANCPYPSLQQYQDDADYTADNASMKSQVQTLSCGLAEIATTTNTPVVQFIHQSVKDFFIGEGLLALDGGSSSIDTAIGMAHFRLSRTCVRYLAMEEINQSLLRLDPDDDPASIRAVAHDLNQAFPFLRYATTSWAAHTKESDTRSISQEDLLELFDWPSNILVELWVKSFGIVASGKVDRPCEGMDLVHVLSMYGILGPLIVVLQRGGRIEAADKNGRRPLSWAARYGHEAVVGLLLEKEADFEAADMYNRTPLSLAAEDGHDAVARLLHKKGA